MAGQRNVGGSAVYTIRDRLLRKGDYIYGSFLKPESVDGYINGVNPGDRSDVLGRFPFSEQDVDEAIDAASLGARFWRRVNVAERANALYRFREALLHLHEHLAILITRESGKPLWEARQEVHATVRMVDVLLEDGVSMLSSQAVDEVGARMDWIPRGVVAILSPYNMPLLVPSTQSATAILSGNAVVLKPSKFTPGVGQAVADLWDRCRLPRGVFNMVEGSGSVIGQRLVVHLGVDMLLFTGSFDSAMAVRRTIFDRPELPAVYHCGGKGLAMVLDDADLDRAIYEVMVGAFLTTGQRHNSTARVIVTDAIYERFVHGLVQHTSRINVGYGFSPDTFQGPLISENLRTRYRRYSRALASKGHIPLLPAANESVETYRGFYVRPAIYEVQWENGNPFLNEEPPGPILLVYRVSSWEEAAALHNQAFYRPVTSVFLDIDSGVLPELLEVVRTGALNVNRGTLGSYLRLPRVGLGRSSNGHPDGLQLLHVLTYPRAFLLDQQPFNPTALVPGINWRDEPRDPDSSEEEPEAEPTAETQRSPTTSGDDEIIDLSSALESVYD